MLFYSSSRNASGAQRSTFRWPAILAFSVTLLLVTCWQYAYCASRTPPGWHFFGFTCDGGDQQEYLSLMERARSGQFFLDNFYTGERERPVYWNLLWWALGTFCRLTGLSLSAVFQGSRILFSLLFLLLLAGFIREFLAGDRERWCAFILIALGTGLGWLLVAVLPLSTALRNSADLSVPEGFAFLSMMWKPHLVFALTMQLSVLWLFFRACESGDWRPAVGAALLLLVVGFAHAFDLVTINPIAWAFAVLRSAQSRAWRPLAFAAGLTAASLPPVLFLSHITKISPNMAAWEAQNVFRSPSVWFYLLGFGVVVLPLLLFPRSVAALAQESPRNRFLLVWLVCNTLLLFTGGLLPFERRLVQGLQIPLVLLSVQLFFSAALPRLLRSRVVQAGINRRLLTAHSLPATLTALWLWCALPTSLYHLTATSFACLPPTSPSRYYAAPDELAAAAYLRAHAPEGSVLLAPEVPGAWLPHQARCRVFVGHEMETRDYRRKSDEARRFFAGMMNAAEASALLHDSSVDFVYWPKTGQHSLNLLDTNLVFDSSRVQVWQVTTPQRGTNNNGAPSTG